jgi:hypothetical protein
VLDRYTRENGHVLYRAFHVLGSAEQNNGDTASCLSIKRKIAELIPLERVDPPSELRREHEELCSAD